MKYQHLLQINQKQPLPWSLNCLICFGAGTTLEDNGVLPFFENLDLFTTPASKSITDINFIFSPNKYHKSILPDLF